MEFAEEEGHPDGLTFQWLSCDDRKFGDVISDWMSKVAHGNAEEFLQSLGLQNELTEDDIVQLIAGGKAPSRELTHFLCGCVPSDVCSWVGLRKRGYAAARGKEQITIPSQALKTVRLQKLREIARTSSQGPQQQNNHAASAFVEWLVDTIEAKAESMGRTANAEKSMESIANALKINIDQLKGAAYITGGDIADKAEALADLLNLENDDFDQAVALAASAWSGAARKTDMAYPIAMKFLRYTQGMNQADFAASLQLPTLSVAGIELASVSPSPNLLKRLPNALGLTAEESALLAGFSARYSEGLKREFHDKLEPVAKRFAASGLSMDALMCAAANQPQLFIQAPETLIRNIEGVVEHFKNDGLTLKDYLVAAKARPSLFCQKPETLIRNVESVVGHFKAHGLTLSAYLGAAATERPMLFYQKPERLIKNIEGVVEHFKAHGLTLSAYLGAAVDHPQLFYQKPETLIKNIEGVVEHFKAHGLTLKDYLVAAVKQPPLFCQKPETLIKNIEGVVGHFKDHGLTLSAYLGGAVEQPTLFCQRPETLIRNVESVVEHFKAHGLTLSAYLKAATKRPQIIYQKPETLIRNVESVVEHFKDHGLTLSAYLDAAVEGPHLFYQKPETLIGNIEGVVNHFKNDGLTLSAYLRAAIKRPQLFYQKPETLIGNINYVIDMYRKRLFVLDSRRGPKRNDAPQTDCDTNDLRPVFDMLVNVPQRMTLARDNYTLRAVCSAVAHDTPPSASILSRPKEKLKSTLRTALGHQDKGIPVQKTHIPDGLYDEHGNPTGNDQHGNAISPKERLKLIGPHAKNLLHRALVRQRILEGTVEQDAGSMAR